MEYPNQKYCREGPQSERLLESATNKITPRMSQSNELQRRIADKNRNSREYHIKRYSQGVSQTNVLPVSVTIKRATKAHHNQNYRMSEGVPKSD